MNASIGGLRNWPWRRRFTLILLFALFWLAFMPVHPYRPYCKDPETWKPVYFGPRLSQPFRESVKGYLDGGLSDTGFGVPYFEVGDYLFVPINEWTDFPEPLSDRPWYDLLFHPFFGWDTEFWTNVNGKDLLRTADVYANEHPRSRIAELRTSYWTGVLQENVDTTERYRRECALLKAVVDVGLDE